MTKKTTTSPALLIAMWLVQERKLLVLAAISLIAIYSFALRKPYSVIHCNRTAQERARSLMLQRANQNPSNAQLSEAAKANLYANEDYNPLFKNCMIERGYQL